MRHSQRFTPNDAGLFPRGRCRDNLHQPLCMRRAITPARRREDEVRYLKIERSWRTWRGSGHATVAAGLLLGTTAATGVAPAMALAGVAGGSGDVCVTSE